MEIRIATMGGTLVRRSLLWGLLLATWAISECSAQQQQEVVITPQNTTELPEYCSIFTHMVKSGGTTIRDQLIEATYEASPPILGLGCTASMSLMQGPTGQCAIDMKTTPVLASAFAELMRARLEELGRQCDFFTMVRHPIDRLVSAFFYCPVDHDLNRRTSKWCSGPQNVATAQPLLLEYATTHWKNIGVNQMIMSSRCPLKYSSFCADSQEVGRTPGDMTTPDGWACIELAQAALGSYKAVGIFEHFELSMKLFDATVRSPVAQWTASKMSNPGTQSSLRQELVDWAYLNTELRRFLAPDLMLYDFAVSVFQQQTRDAFGTKW